jgi:hypothetical protein
MIIPAYLPYYVVAGATGIIATLLFGLIRALRDAGWAANERAATVGAAAVSVIGWFFLAIALASADAYRAGDQNWNEDSILDRRDTLRGGLLIWRSSRLARIIDAVPQHWLTAIQLYRALGVRRDG